MPEKNPLNVALEYLDHQALSEQKLAQKLKIAGYSESAIEESFSQLRKMGYIDDYRLGEARIHQLLGRLKSRAFSRLDLQSHGISKEIIHELLDNYYSEEQELEIALKLIRKKSTSSKPQLKIRAYLVRNGFSENTVRHCFPSIDPT